MSKEKLKEYLQSISKDRVVELCLQYQFDAKIAEQQLAEKDKEIAHLKEKDNYHLRYELAGADETITNLKKQLAEKVKEIELLKHLGSHETNMELFKENTKLIIEKRQFAIQELEKVKEEMDLNGNSYCEIRQGTSPHNPTDYAWFNYVKFRNYLNQQIKELKGE